MVLFGKLGIFGRKSPATFRVNVRDRSQGEYDSQGRYYYKSVDYPSAILQIRPGQTMGQIKHMLDTLAPGFCPDPRLLFPKDFPFGWQANWDKVITELHFQSLHVIDEVTIAGIALRSRLEEALKVYPGLRSAKVYNEISNLQQPHAWTYHRSAASGFDLQIGIKDGLVDSIAMYLPGWIEEQEKTEPGKLVAAKSRIAKRAEDEVADRAWQALTDPNERLVGWGQYRDRGSSGLKAWEWYARRLIETGPDEWHDAADQWNWDNGVEPLTWIIRQSECDRATALLVFHLGEPHFHAEKLTEGRDLGNDKTYALLAEIRERWFSGKFQRSEIGFDVSEYDDPPTATDSDRDFVAASMRHSIPGRKPLKGLFFKVSPFKRSTFS
jgi:Domain of unknown function (DUF4274)